ncbi:MAG TPA: radical SAM protein [Polyangia bacterium]|jgi:pyruvate-formate lyase-activating enzyme
MGRRVKPGTAGQLVTNVVAREAAATEERQWVRLTKRCNNRCLFCHDAYRHDGGIIDPEEIRAQIRAGRERGATRLILSGGEPTIHPAFLDFVAYGREVGYTWLQTISNGRMFAYDKFVRRAIAAGLCEATLSMHGHTPELYDRLVGVGGAFPQALKGLRNLLAAGLVVSVDVVVSKLNVRHLPDLLRFYLGLGVREFDLLHLIPFGRGFDEHRDVLFYDPAEERPYILEALQLALRPDVHLWTNRWPAPLLEGVEQLIQDPHKINDEVRGGFDNFSGFVRGGAKPDCHGDRCQHCFLARFCRTLIDTRERLLGGTFAAVAVDAQAAAGLGAGARAAIERQGGAALRVTAASPAALERSLAALPRGAAADLELDVPGLAKLPPGLAPRVRRVVVRRAADLAAALALPRALVEIPVDRATVAVARQALAEAPARVVLRPPGRELLSQTVELDLSPAELAALTASGARCEGIPACLGAPRPVTAAGATLDAAILDGDGVIDVFAFVHGYIRDHYRTRSLRCAACAEAAACDGAHINTVRAHGFGWMRPIAGGGAAP